MRFSFRKLIAASGSALLLLGACKAPQVSTGTDDVYANPAEERAAAKAAAEQKAKQQALERQQQEELAKQAKEKEEAANPYYKDPSYNADDYYDYEYAARINRFHRPIYGAGFYDPYYTNLYTYNQNPAFWGTSIYSSYGYGMPSMTFGYYSMGISTGWGYNSWNNCGWPYYYDPFCYNSGFYMGYGYSPWGYNNWAYQSGFNHGYYHGYNNAQWGYYNSMDPNSGYGKASYGPRKSGTGTDSDPRRREAGRVEGFEGRRSYIEAVSAEQEKQPRFSGATGDRRIDRGGRVNESGGERRSANPAGNPQPSQQQSQPRREGRRENSRRVEERQQQPETRPRENSNRSSGTWNPAPSNPGGRGNTGGSNAPRNSGRGTDSRPRR